MYVAEKRLQGFVPFWAWCLLRNPQCNTVWTTALPRPLWYWRQQLSSAFETVTDKAASAQECAVQALDRAGHRNILAALAAEPVPNDVAAAFDVFMSRLPQGVADREVGIIRILHATCNDAWFLVRAFMPPSSPSPQLEVA